MSNIARAQNAVMQELPEGKLPEWIMLMPGEGAVATRDDRGQRLGWKNSNPDGIVKEFENFGMPLPGDFEHQSMTAQEKTNPTPGSGWVSEMEVRGNGEIWGKVKWTAQAAKLIATGGYRYISPVFDYNKKTGEITKIVSFGLTNNPNLYLRAAAKAEQGDRAMASALHGKLMKALNGMEEAKDEDVKKACMAAMEEGAAEAPADGAGEPDADDSAPREAGPVKKKPVARAANDEDDPSATPVLDADEPDGGSGKGAGRMDATKFVPMSMYNELARKVKTIDSERTARAVNSAIKAGKVAPANRAWAMSYAAKDEAGFLSFLEGAPAIVGTTDRASNTAKIEAPIETQIASLSAEEKEVNRQFGRSDADYVKARNEAIKDGSMFAGKEN